jgi:putative alpha-1,2-mannosidase
MGAFLSSSNQDLLSTTTTSSDNKNETVTTTTTTTTIVITSNSTTTVESFKYQEATQMMIPRRRKTYHMNQPSPYEESTDEELQQSLDSYKFPLKEELIKQHELDNQITMTQYQFLIGFDVIIPNAACSDANC